jgi:hypothetical protein
MDCMLYALVGDDALSEPAKIIFTVEEYSGAPGDPDVTAGSRIKINEKNIAKAYLELNRVRLRVKIGKNSGQTEIVMPRKKIVKITKNNLKNPVPSPQVEAELVLQSEDGQKQTMTLNLNPPEINECSFFNNTLQLQGKFFGSRQKVYLLNEETKELIKMKILKNSLNFRNRKGKAGAMDPDTGESYLEAVPKKLPEPGRYKVLIVNSLGIGSSSEDAGMIPEVTVTGN